MSSTLDQLAVNTSARCRSTAFRRPTAATLGLPLGAAPMAYVLWTRFLRHNPRHPKWPDHDRFAFSAGHGSMLLYSLLYLTGDDLTLDDLKSFRQWGSKTPGHPEYGLVPGAELTTGPLGQGFANGVGLAIAEAHLAATYNRAGHTIVDHRTFGIASDGDLMEGVAYEAASLAGHLHLGKLVYLYDYEPGHPVRFDESGLQRRRRTALRGHGLARPARRRRQRPRCHRARHPDRRSSSDRPSLIIVRTTLGFGSPKRAGTLGRPTATRSAPTKSKRPSATWAGRRPTTFFVPDDALQRFARRPHAVRSSSRTGSSVSTPTPASSLSSPRSSAGTQAGKLPQGWDRDLPSFSARRRQGRQNRHALGRRRRHQRRGEVAARADRWQRRPEPSTDTALKDGGDFESPAQSRHRSPGRRRRRVGLCRPEHLLRHPRARDGLGHQWPRCITAGSRAFTARRSWSSPTTCGRPIRLAALSDLPSIFVFTHDSIGLGEDGPTHQPIEHLPALRAIPNLVVFRPADANEVTEGWRVAIERHDGPTMLVFSRQPLPIYDRTRFGPAAARVRAPTSWPTRAAPTRTSS